jgi:uncharacterized phage protein (TIGR02220 family)
LTDFVGKTVRLPPELWEELAVQAKKMDRSVNYVIIQAVKDHVRKVVPDVSKLIPSQYHGDTTVIPSPDPTPARAGTDPEKKKKKKKSAAKTDATMETEIVISEMNRLAGREWEPEAWKGRLGKLLAKGFTVDDFLKVVHWRASEAKRQSDWGWFKPDTIFRIRSFGEKLDNAKAGVQIGESAPNHTTPSAEQPAPPRGVYIEGEGWHHYEGSELVKGPEPGSGKGRETR